MDSDDSVFEMDNESDGYVPETVSTALMHQPVAA